jgi:hypothetical protein
MSAYQPIAWHDLFVGTIGASAALTGLLFVAISINLQQILKFPNLPGRAGGTLGILLSALVVSCFGLAPGQSNTALGVEIALTGAVVTFQAAWITVHNRKVDDPNTWKIEPLLTLFLSDTAFLIGGISVATGVGGGLYWVLAALVLAFTVTVVNAWVLLVEVLR